MLTDWFLALICLAMRLSKKFRGTIDSSPEQILGLGSSVRHIQDAHTRTFRNLDSRPWRNDRYNSFYRRLKSQFPGSLYIYTLGERTHLFAYLSFQN